MDDGFKVYYRELASSFTREFAPKIYARPVNASVSPVPPAVSYHPPVFVHPVLSSMMCSVLRTRLL